MPHHEKKAFLQTNLVLQTEIQKDRQTYESIIMLCKLMFLAFLTRYTANCFKINFNY